VTETLLAWDIEPIAVTRFCEQPRLRAVGGTKDPDVAAIVALRPDVVVMNDEENRREDADALVAAGVSLHVTHVEAVADVQPCLIALASAVGLAEPPMEIVTWRFAGESPADGRAAFVPIWRRPWMSLNSSTYGSSMLAAVGLRNVFADAAARYPETTLDEAAARRPDLVLAPSEPYPFAARHVAELRQVAPDVRLVDGQDMFWWGTRTAGALGRLAQAVEP
jgi:ABC-type Fe3+-hydroxamate transport system substrate-binding protein